MALKPVSAAPPATAKEFAKGASVKVLPSPKAGRIKSGEDSEAYGLNFMLYGPWGSGKTYAAEGLLRHGFKVLFVNTDIGSNGTITVKMALKNKDLGHLAANYKMLSLNSYDEIVEFIKEPAIYFPEIYDWDPDFLFWDGFGYAQQTEIMAKAGEMIVEQNDINEGKKEVSALRETGFKFELADFQVVRNMTVRLVKGYCSLHNKKTGKMWHKVFTTQEALKSKKKEGDGGGSELVDSMQPLLTGAGGVLTCGAFDLILRTEKSDDGKRFRYNIEGGKKMSTKNRGFNLPATMDADFYEVWKQVASDLDIKVGAADPSNIAPVLVAEEVA